MRSQLLRLAGAAVVYGAGQALVRFISLLLLPLFTSYLSPADYGISSILGVLTYLVTPIFALGVAGALGVIYYEREDPRRKAATIWTAFVVMTTSATVLVALGSILVEPLSQFLFPQAQAGYDLTYLVTLSLVTAGAGIAAQPLLMSLQLEERARIFVLITAGSALVSILLSVILVVVMRRGVDGFIEAGVIAQSLTLLLAAGVAMRLIPFRTDWRLASELLRLGMPLIPSFIAVFAMMQANKYILQGFEGLSSVGVYTIGFNLGLFVTLVVTGFTTAWFPFFSSFMERREEASPLFARVTTYYVLGAGALSLLFYVGARPVIMLATQPAFHGAYVSVGGSAAAHFLIGLHSILLAGMYFAKEVRYQVVIQGTAAICSVGLNVALVAAMGALGAAIALPLGLLGMVMLQHAWNVRRGYLLVPYETGRLLAFGILYVIVASLYLLDREFPLAVEMILSAVGALVVVSALVAILTRQERAQAVEFIQTALRRVTGAQPSQ